MTQILTLRRAVCRLGCVAVLLAAAPVAAQVHPGRLSGSIVDEAGAPVGGLTLIFHAEADGATRRIPVKKKGRFTQPFFPSGIYKVELEGSDYFIQALEYVLLDAGGLEVESFRGDAHPTSGLAPIRVPAGQRLDLTFVVAPKKVQQSRAQRAMVAETAGSLRKASGLLESGRLDEALAACDEILADKPDMGSGHYLRGGILKDLGRLEEADQALRRALELAPDQEGLRGVLGNVLMDRASAKREAGAGPEAPALEGQAADLFRQELERSPGSKLALLNLAGALERSEERDALVPVLEELLRVDPDYLAGYFRLARIHTQRGAAEQALAVIDRVPVADENAALAMYNVAIGLYNEKDYASAIAVLTKAVEIAPDHPKIHQLLGGSHLAAGRTDDALRHLERFLELAPDDPEAATARRLVSALNQR